MNCCCTNKTLASIQESHILFSKVLRKGDFYLRAEGPHLNKRPAFKQKERSKLIQMRADSLYPSEG